MKGLRSSVASLSVVAFAAMMVATSPKSAMAKPTAEAARDAGKHFQRGVALFNEADYSGALAEFKRAHEIAPNAAVLYNLAQTHYQLRAYAAALQTFERYLAESGPNAEHGADVEAHIDTLRTRVGRVDIVGPGGAEVTIDDEPSGTLPLGPVMVAVGRRKITVSKAGVDQTKFVEVTAGETVRVEIKPPVRTAVEPSSPPPAIPSRPSSEPMTPTGGGFPLATASFIAAGALAGGALVTGLVTLNASSELKNERSKPPGDATRSRLDALAGNTTRFAAITDVLAAAALVGAGVGVYSLVTTPSDRGSTRTGVGFVLGPTQLAVNGRF